MEFYTVCQEKRPVRLNEQTRKFAWESLHGKYGDLAMKTPGVSMDLITGFDEMTEYKRYDCAIAKIASDAPLRICEDELISGAATLGQAISHQVPAAYKGKILWPSVSHVTYGFGKAVKHGIDTYENEINERLERTASEPEHEFLSSLLNTINSMKIWHKRYLSALKDIKPDITIHY